MSARIVPAHHGARWLAEGWRLFRKAPFVWLAALMGAAAVLLVVVPIRLVGAPLFAILTPALWAALMAVARAVAGETANPRDSARELLRAARPLALLGAIYLLANVTAVAATMPFGEGLLAGWMLFGQAPSPEAQVSPAFLVDVILALLFYLPAMLAFWFSPMLAAWQRMGAAKALFFSIAACFLCWRAFSVYGIVAALVFLAVSSVISIVSAVLVEGLGLAPGAATVVALPVFVAYVGTLVASVYACYRDVFDVDGVANAAGVEPPKSPTIPP
jgi:hypothetical protein